MHFRYLGKVRVKGKKTAIGVYECLNGESKQKIIKKLSYQDHFEIALAHYNMQRFSQAIVAFEAIHAQNQEDQIVHYFLQKAKLYLIQGVPEDWVR